MGNIAIAAALLTDLLQLAGQVNAMIATAQAGKTDVSAAQLAQLAAGYTAAKAKLDSDIAAASAAGK
jgi:hypothetical protein